MVKPTQRIEDIRHVCYVFIRIKESAANTAQEREEMVLLAFFFAVLCRADVCNEASKNFVHESRT